MSATVAKELSDVSSIEPARSGFDGKNAASALDLLAEAPRRAAGPCVSAVRSDASSTETIAFFVLRIPRVYRDEKTRAMSEGLRREGLRRVR